MTSSPDQFTHTTYSRSYSPKLMNHRDSLSPRPLSPSPRRTTSRSPSASPVTSNVPHASFVSGTISVIHEDIESTRHSEQLAIGVYKIARAAIRVLCLLEPQRELAEVQTLGTSSWLDLNTAIHLQRQCFELSRHLDRNQVCNPRLAHCDLCSNTYHSPFFNWPSSKHSFQRTCVCRVTGVLMTQLVGEQSSSLCLMYE